MSTLVVLRRLTAFIRGSVSTDHLSESDIAGFLDRDLSDNERTRVERHLEDCGECRGAVVDVRRIASTFDEAHSAPPARSRNPRGIRWLPLGAGAALAASLSFMWLSRSETQAVTQSPIRSGGTVVPDARPRLESSTPADDALVTGDSVAFTWRAARADLYRLVVQDETGQPVLSTETPDTLVIVRGERAFLPGRLFFWRVDAITDGVSASSEVRKFRIAP